MWDIKVDLGKFAIDTLEALQGEKQVYYNVKEEAAGSFCFNLYNHDHDVGTHSVLQSKYYVILY